MFKKKPSPKIYLVKQLAPMFRLMPYLFRGRNESAVYFKKTLRLAPLERFIKEQRARGKYYSLFGLVLTALSHTAYRRPQIMRFVSGRKIYQRETFDVQYVVKTKLTDEGNETLVHLVLSQEKGLEEIQKLLKQKTEQAKQQEEALPPLFVFLTKLPRFLLNLLSKMLFLLDDYQLLPQALQKELPFFSTLFISNLASIGAEAAFHHLYEFGSNSLFMTMGKAYEQLVIQGEKVHKEKVMDFMFTVDERICDGYYFIQSLKLFENLLAHPELLLSSPMSSVDVFTYKAKQRKKRKSLKEEEQE